MASVPVAAQPCLLLTRGILTALARSVYLQCQ
jgi:hypothetical protein